MSILNGDPALPEIPKMDLAIAPIPELNTAPVAVKKKAAVVVAKTEPLAVVSKIAPSFCDSVQESLESVLKKLAVNGSKTMKDLVIVRPDFPGQEMVLIEMKGLVYAKIKKEGGVPVVRIYAFIPPEAGEAVTLLVKESGIGAVFSPDSFTRPSAI